MNQITDEVNTGTIGELLVQIRLLQYGVQAAPPIKDSGNDLIAVNGTEFRSISVRTTKTGVFNKPPAERMYHVLAVVYLVGIGNDVALDESCIYFVPQAEVANASTNCRNIEDFRISRESIERSFGRLSI